MYLAWRYSGADPYRLYNLLDEDYRPVGIPEADPAPPKHPGRVRSFVYGCGNCAFEDDIRFAGGKVQRKQARALGLAG